jgi:hypothetical protein
MEYAAALLRLLLAPKYSSQHSRDSLVGRDGLRTRPPGFLSRLRQQIFLHSVHDACGAQLASYPMTAGGSFIGGKADYSPPSSAEVENGGNIPPLLHANSWRHAYLIRYMGQFTLLQFFIHLSNLFVNTLNLCSWKA